MEIVLVGLDHKTAPIELRERLYLADDTLRVALHGLRAAGLEEVIILSTCNRLEVLGVAEDAENSFRIITTFIANSQNIPISELAPHLYCLEGRNAVQHLMRVACALESQILGETQILGQVAHALDHAQAFSTTGSTLSRLMSAVLHAGKRARTETAISRHTLSVSQAAVLLIQQKIALASSHILVVGAGQMAELAVKALQAHAATNIQLIGRTDSKVKKLADELDIQALAWANLSSALSETDVVITATSASHPIIHTEHLQSVNREQINRLHLLVDIGLPRNIASDVRHMPGVHLYDIDDLQGVVEVNRNLRQSEIAHVESIISQELATFMEWLHTRQVVPLITELRHHVEALAQTEIEQALQRLPDINAHEQEIITQMAHRIVNKLLHAPTVNLKSRAIHDYHYAHTVRELFALDQPHAVEHVNNE